MTLRIAFIGAGHMARHHARAIQRANIASLFVGVFDRDERRAASFARETRTRAFPSLDALLDNRPDVVHVCTPPAAHYEAARAALDAGAHVYVEKPFALTRHDAVELLAVADARARLVCAGHQLLRDPAFTSLLQRPDDLGTLVQADSIFTFRPVGDSRRSSPSLLAHHLIDILPHPLYSLICVMERARPDAQRIEVAWVDAAASSVHAILRAGDLTGRLFVSLRARPVASSLTLTGTAGSLTCDFVRSLIVGSPNPGTEPLEKVLTPIIEGAQLMARTAAGTMRRLRSAAGYPGLSELITAFYEAVMQHGEPPVAGSHLIRVTEVFESLVSQINLAAGESKGSRARVTKPTGRPGVVVTGARGFLGHELARALAPVRGIGRGDPPDDPHVTDWVVADLSRGLSPNELTGADIVVHAAAETAGGYDDHRRNTIGATRNLLRTMHAAGVRKLLLVSSLSVIRPPRWLWEQQNERTPRPSRPRALGPYVWGKCLQEALVEREAPRLGIDVRVVRPGALIDWHDPTLPGLMGRRLFAHWHLGLGRPMLPIAVCDVAQCADAIAWCVRHFNEIEPVVHLFDPDLTTRGALLARMAARGWRGRMIWVPISAIALGVSSVRGLLALCQFRWPSRLAAWSILRPRRYDASLSATIIGRAHASASQQRISPGDLITIESKAG